MPEVETAEGEAAFRGERAGQQPGMTSRAAVTVNRPRENVERQWQISEPLQGSDAKGCVKVVLKP